MVSRSPTPIGCFSSSGRLSIRLDLASGASIGPDKIALLDEIGRVGSISAASRELGMSYRRAWKIIEELNQSLGVPLVKSAAGGRGGGGANLTKAGRTVIGVYRAIEADTALVARKHLQALSLGLLQEITLTPGYGSCAEHRRSINATGSCQRTSPDGLPIDRALYSDGNNAAAEKTMRPMPIQGEKLTTWSAQSGGTQVCLGVTDGDGTDHCIVLPVEVLSGLMMTLPRMLQSALDERLPGGSLRIVQRLGNWQLEQQKIDEGLILKLGIQDGFEVAFALYNDHAGSLGAALLETPREREPLPLRRLN